MPLIRSSSTGECRISVARHAIDWFGARRWRRRTVLDCSPFSRHPAPPERPTDATINTTVDATLTASAGPESTLFGLENNDFIPQAQDVITSCECYDIAAGGDIN
jgi:hypothetical protein